MKYKKIDFITKGDENGSLIALEENKNIPFEIKRVYYIFDTKEGVRRGFHAHKSLEQALICVNGSCDILLDDGKEKSIMKLENRNEGIHLKKLIWHEMFNFSADCVLMVLASDLYCEEDYIRNYEEFLNYIGKY
jgi:dTDP-4-dehydrorhamnose 3,5-epimerase-like enzyme